MIGKMVLAYLGISVLMAILFVTAARIFLGFKRQQKMTWVRMSFILALLSGFAVVILASYYPNVFSIGLDLSVFSGRNIILILVASLPAALITLLVKPQQEVKLPIYINVADGMAMEVLLRLLVQNLFIIMGATSVMFGEVNLAIILTALIYPQFMVIQEKIQRNPITIKILPEVVASIWFSLWAGYLYFTTGSILLPMVAHGLERLVLHLVRNIKKNKINE